MDVVCVCLFAFSFQFALSHSPAVPKRKRTRKSAVRCRQANLSLGFTLLLLSFSLSHNLLTRESASYPSELSLLLRACLSEHPDGATLEQICKWIYPLLHFVKRMDFDGYYRPRTPGCAKLVEFHLGRIGATLTNGRYHLKHTPDAPSVATMGAMLRTVKGMHARLRRSPDVVCSTKRLYCRRKQ